MSSNIRAVSTNVNYVFYNDTTRESWDAGKMRKVLQDLNGFDKEVKWLHADLSTSYSGVVGRCLWKICQYFDTLRSFFYDINTTDSHAHMKNIREFVVHSNDRSLANIFNQALNSADKILHGASDQREKIHPIGDPSALRPLPLPSSSSSSVDLRFALLPPSLPQSQHALHTTVLAPSGQVLPGSSNPEHPFAASSSLRHDRVEYQRNSSNDRNSSRSPLLGQRTSVAAAALRQRANSHSGHIEVGERAYRASTEEYASDEEFLDLSARLVRNPIAVLRDPDDLATPPRPRPPISQAASLRSSHSNARSALSNQTIPGSGHQRSHGAMSRQSMDRSLESSLMSQPASLRAAGANTSPSLRSQSSTRVESSPLRAQVGVLPTSAAAVHAPLRAQAGVLPPLASAVNAPLRVQREVSTNPLRLQSVLFA